MPVRLWRAYQRALHAYPVMTASISAGCLMSTGDILSQFLVQKRSLAEYDGKRTLRFAFFGTFLGGPVITVWYSTLARVFGNTKFGPLKMVLCDQLLFAPIFLPYFLSGMEILKGEGLEAIKSKLKHVGAYNM
ncbi:hypothetical protein DPMN_070070 [Dreissena polymorpha]|uniref:Mitochondrial inner membrane protein Mpv17 n=1 Tax=Dreissena polymorpha TaxID=45954 RepID=A0A9D4BX48_DREPO|nr:hypothetical protein DPMN_070070 [Dreissena polymorpha]